jgi:hypothetical protein
MDASMGGFFRQSGEFIGDIYRNWGIGIFALPVLIVIALVGMVKSRPSASSWMSDVDRTELAASTSSPGAASTQLAQWAAASRTDRAN